MAKGDSNTAGATPLESATATESTERDAALRESASQAADRRGAMGDEVRELAKDQPSKGAQVAAVPQGDQMAAIIAGAEAGARAAGQPFVNPVTTTPGIAQLAREGNLPDPKELAAKARGISGGPNRLDETIPGGLTVHPDGYFKNAHGQEVDATGKVLSEAPVNPNGNQDVILDARVAPTLPEANRTVS